MKLCATVRHFRPSSSKLGASARFIGDPPGLAGKVSTNRLRLAVVTRADLPILTASSLPSRISSYSLDRPTSRYRQAGSIFMSAGSKGVVEVIVWLHPCARCAQWTDDA